MAKKLYYGGTVLTMTHRKAAEAVLIENGRVLAVGERAVREADGKTERICLEGHTLLPGFIDSHSHFSGCAAALLQCSVEEASDFQELTGTIAAYIREKKIPPGEWVRVCGFDPDCLAEHAVPDRFVLDRVSAEHPLVMQHKSGHVGVLNSLGLKRAQIGRETPDPPGGHIEKRDGEPTGYLEEKAFLQVLGQLPQPSVPQLMEAYEQTQRLYASFGITTLQEGMMVGGMIPLYQKLCAERRLWLDVVAYPSIQERAEIRKAFPGALRGYQGRLRLGGCKIFLDGSPQSRTAWVRTPYEQGEYGTSVMRGEEVEACVRAALDEGFQLLAHCNGDAAAEQYLCAFENAAKKGADPAAIRPVMIHAQLVDGGQLARMRPLGMIPSFFIGHVYHWGDVHIRNLGYKRASRISPAGTALRLGLPFTFHQDSPVIRPDMLETIWCAVNRRTKGGELLDGGEKITAADALAAVTANGAYQYFEEGEKGAIAPGLLADFVILDRDPLTVKEEELRSLRVLETIKEGRTVYRRDA